MALGAARFKPSCGFSGGGKFGADCDELRAEIVAGARDAAFHGADVEVKRGPNLFVGVILDVAQREDFAVAGIESRHERFDEFGKFDTRVFLRGVGRLLERFMAMRCSHVASEESPRKRARLRCAGINVS